MAIFSHFKKSKFEQASNPQAYEEILKEFKHFMDDAEDMFHSATSATGEDLLKIKSQFRQRVRSAKERVGNASNSIIKQAYKTADLTNDYVHQKPWTAIGTGVALSLLAGYLLSTKRDTQ
ncbi:YqjD family protein [Cellvibrio sp.]|uniref:DUF883 family protein n=1 Tax=Cellvibrio sp. TaxID=1965322 RepID=UPI003964874A